MNMISYFSMIGVSEHTLSITVLQILSTSNSQDEQGIMLNELIGKLEETLNTKFKGTKYTKFKETLEFLEQKEFIQINRINRTKYCKINPAGNIYLQCGRYVPLSSMYNFLINPLSYLYVFIIQTLPFMIFAALHDHFSEYFLNPDFFVLLLFVLNVPLLNRFYLFPLIEKNYGIYLHENKYDLFHPIMAYHVNQNQELSSHVRKSINLSMILSFLTTSILYYLPVLSRGLNTIGKYGIPINSSLEVLLFHLFFFPIADFVLFTTFYIMAFTGYWIITRPLILPKRLFTNPQLMLDMHWRMFIISTIIYFTTEYLALYNLIPSIAYPYHSIFIIMVFIVFGTGSVLFTLWILSYIKIKNIISEQKENDEIIQNIYKNRPKSNVFHKIKENQ